MITDIVFFTKLDDFSCTVIEEPLVVFIRCCNFTIVHPSKDNSVHKVTASNTSWRFCSIIFGVGYGSILTHVLQPSSCKYFNAAKRFSRGAAPGSIRSLNDSSSDTNVMPYSFFFDRSTRVLGRIPFVRTEHFYATGIYFFDSSNTHILDFFIPVHKRVGSKAKLYRFYFIFQLWYFFIQKLKVLETRNGDSQSS